MTRPRSRRRGQLVAVVLAATLLAGCGGDDESTESGGDAGDRAIVGAPAPAEDLGESADGGERSADGKGAPGVELPGTLIAYTGQLLVETENVGADRDRAVTLVDAAGGRLQAETATGGEVATTTLTFEVPPERFPELVEVLGRLGEEVDRQVTGEDVTEEVADVESRLATQRASVVRVRALLLEATTISEIVQIEAELARREAELESLQARSRVLAQRTESATLTLTLQEPGGRSLSDGDDGFLEGLERGWEALKASTVVLVTVLGAVLPFLVVGALVVVPLLAWRRRGKRRAHPPEVQTRAGEGGGRAEP